MDVVGIIVGVSWIFVGLVCVGLAIPLMNGKVGRNPFYGMRYAKAFESDEAWFAINRYGGRRMFFWSLPLIAIGVVCLFLPLSSHPAMALFAGFAPLVFVFIPAVETWRFARGYG